MASASSTSAKNLFVDSKRRLGERVQMNVNNMASICRQVLRGSQSADLLAKAARSMALQDNTVENTSDNLQKLQLLVVHLSYQQEAIEKSATTLPQVREQCAHTHTHHPNSSWLQQSHPHSRQPTSMKISLGWQGGAEALFGNVRSRSLDLSAITSSITDDCKMTSEGGSTNRTDESKSSDSCAWTLRRLLAWLKKDSGWLTGAEELFFCGDSLRNGVMVLINDTDWELLGELDYELVTEDNIVFISTLHGG